MGKPSDEDVAKWHRWFAVECNNRREDLLAKPNRDCEENQEIKSAAYAAAFHWSKVGNPINDARGASLLSHLSCPIYPVPSVIPLYQSRQYLVRIWRLLGCCASGAQ